MWGVSLKLGECCVWVRGWVGGMVVRNVFFRLFSKNVFRHLNVLSPEGRCVAYPVGVQLSLLVIYLG